MTWHDARDFCENMQSHLLRIESIEELEFLRNVKAVERYLQKEPVLRVWEERRLVPGKMLLMYRTIKLVLEIYHTKC